MNFDSFDPRKTLETTLENTFSANFVAYYKAHVAHINIRSRTFFSDHSLLQKVYETLQEEIDVLGEMLRTIKAFVPNDLDTVINISPIADSKTEGDADELLEDIEDTLELLIEQYRELYMIAEMARDVDISNHVQDFIGKLAKLKWMIESTINDRDD
jgi:DNA-binding ferritin-like protein